MRRATDLKLAWASTPNYLVAPSALSDVKCLVSCAQFGAVSLPVMTTHGLSTVALLMKGAEPAAGGSQVPSHQASSWWQPGA